MDKYTGFFKASVIAINPSADELLEILEEEELDDIPPYSGIGKDEIRWARVDLYLKDVAKDILFKHSIYLKDKKVEYKSGAKLWINERGKTQITEKEEYLFSSLKHYETVLSWKHRDGKINSYYKEGAKSLETKVEGNKEYRIAREGEVDLMSLWINSQEKLKKRENYLLDIDKILDGDFSQLRIQKNIPLFVAFAYTTLENEQKIWKEFVPLGDFQNFTQPPTKGTCKKMQNFQDNFLFFNSQEIYRFERLQPVTEDMYPKQEEKSESDY